MEPVIKDIVDNHINLGSTVIVAHNGRIILGRVIKLHTDTEQVTIEPVHSDTGGRREAPSMKPFRRYDYNVFVVNEDEHFMAALKGYTTIQDQDMEQNRKLWHGEVELEDIVL
jgi:hypothetical protein